ILPPSSFCTATLVEDKIFLIGGLYGNDNFNKSNLIFYVFDTKKQIWNQTLTINPPANRISASSIYNPKTGKIYIFGGRFNSSTISTTSDANSTNYPLDMNILDPISYKWSKGSSFNGPSGRDDQAVVLLPSGLILYIGGRSPNNGGYINPSMTELYAYDTNNDTWTTKITTGYNPSPRGSAQAVLIDDGRVIVYGGVIGGASNQLGLPVNDALVVLDTKDFSWTQPSVSSTPPPLSRYQTVTLVGYYLIVAFGQIMSGDTGISTSNIYILDARNKTDYKWIVDFDPKEAKTSLQTNATNTDVPQTNTSVPQTNTSAGNSGNSEKANIGLIVGIVIGVAVIIAIG
ncbi:35_t:CDS:2, partial [Dentiscutata erythropus]